MIVVNDGIVTLAETSWKGNELHVLRYGSKATVPKRMNKLEPGQSRGQHVSVRNMVVVQKDLHFAGMIPMALGGCCLKYQDHFAPKSALP